jgi:hypothetical protein
MGNWNWKFRAQTSRTCSRQPIDQARMYLASEPRQPRREPELVRSSSAATTRVGCLAIESDAKALMVAPFRDLELGISLELGALELLFHVFQQGSVRLDVELGIMQFVFEGDDIHHAIAPGRFVDGSDF